MSNPNPQHYIHFHLQYINYMENLDSDKEKNTNYYYPTEK